MESKQSLTSANLFFLWFGAAVSVAEILTGGYLCIKPVQIMTGPTLLTIIFTFVIHFISRRVLKK